MSRTVLIIDDETSILDTVKAVLTDEGYKTTTARSGETGLASLESSLPDAILLDIWMPEMDGLEVLRRLRQDYPQIPVLMMSGHGTIETAVKATKLGAFDFIEKPLSLEKLLVLLKNAIISQDLSKENQALRQQVQKNKQMIGKSDVINHIRQLISRVAPTTGSVLITGENGTGKEIVAQSIHYQSNRATKPFIIVNCAAIPDELIESELFGHEKGAFTGATQQRRGKFDLAHCGTLFLDEIGDMSLKTQAKVLRILQEQKFERVGGSQTISVDVRVVAATNKDLKEEIKYGRFREDLFYRLNVIPFHVPPLRDRKEDILLLVEHFLKESANTHGRKIRPITKEGIAVLQAYPWPGNVRELKNFIERLMILTTEALDGTPITAAALLSHLEEENISESPSMRFSKEAALASPAQPLHAQSLKDARTEFEKDFILKTLKEHGGNVSKTANTLGIERSHLHKKIKSYGIDPAS